MYYYLYTEPEPQQDQNLNVRTFNSRISSLMVARV